MKKFLLFLFLTVPIYAEVEVCSPKLQCIPPATWQSEESLPPFNAKVRFVKEIKKSGVIMWQWAIVTESRCSANSPKGYEEYCLKKSGDVLFENLPFREKP